MILKNFTGQISDKLAELEKIDLMLSILNQS